MASNFPGQSNMNAAFDRYLIRCTEIYAALPDDWLVFIEHKPYEPAFYSTVISDWGSSLMAATELGPKAKCLVDLGHHPPGTTSNRSSPASSAHGRLAGFHFNDSKYGDDDLNSGSIDPFRLFLVFNELVDAELRKAPGFAPAYMIDQSHNVTDPIEILIASAIEVVRAYVSGLADRPRRARRGAGQGDIMVARQIVKQAFTTDVSPILAEARRRKGGAIDPLIAYRGSGYRAAKAAERPAAGVAAAGIV